MYLFVALFFIVGLGAFADDEAATEASRIIRDFAKHEALLGQPVPTDFKRFSLDGFFSPDGRTIVTTGANNRIVIVLMPTKFRTDSEAVRFTGLMCDFVESSGGQLVSIDGDGFGYHMRNLSVHISFPRYSDGDFLAAIHIANR